MHFVYKMDSLGYSLEKKVMRRKLAHIILNILTHKPYLNRDIIEIIVQISITESTE
jgi:hypothetical protein